MPDIMMGPSKTMGINDARWELFQLSRDAGGCLSQIPANRVMDEIIRVFEAAKFQGLMFGEKGCSIGLPVHFPNGTVLQGIEQHFAELGEILMRVDSEKQYQPEDLPAIKIHLDEICRLEAKSAVGESNTTF